VQRRADGPLTPATGEDSLRASRKHYEAALSAAEGLGENAIRVGEASVVAASSRSITILVGCLIVALVTGLGVAYRLVRSIAVPAPGSYPYSPASTTSWAFAHRQPRAVIAAGSGRPSWLGLTGSRPAA
jgi:hypothetical protein